MILRDLDKGFMYYSSETRQDVACKHHIKFFKSSDKCYWPCSVFLLNNFHLPSFTVIQ